jgi:hypothetical protein
MASTLRDTAIAAAHDEANDRYAEHLQRTLALRTYLERRLIELVGKIFGEEFTGRMHGASLVVDQIAFRLSADDNAVIMDSFWCEHCHATIPVGAVVTTIQNVGMQLIAHTDAAHEVAS